MEDMYTVRTFRENLREAFNKAEAGELVFIERYGKEYQLIANKDKFTLNKHDDLETFEDGSRGVSIKKLYDDPTYTDPEEAA